MNVLNLSTSNKLRREYIKTFINTTSSYYVKNIEQKMMFSDGLCYTGYLWDCLLNAQIISEYQADQLLQKKQKIFIMWDIHSCDRIFIPNYWKFPKSNILSVDIWSKSLKIELPEDIYVFDDTFNWSIIYTHETDSKERRYCLYLDK